MNMIDKKSMMNFHRRDKKAFLKIIEVFLAITIVFVFIMMTQSKSISFSNIENKRILEFLSSDEAFRTDIYSINNYCVNKGAGLPINQKIELALPKYLNYTVCVYDDPNFQINTLPDTKIYVDSYYYAADGYVHKQKIAKLFYWK